MGKKPLRWLLFGAGDADFGIRSVLGMPLSYVTPTNVLRAR